MDRACSMWHPGKADRLCSWPRSSDVLSMESRSLLNSTPPPSSVRRPRVLPIASRSSWPTQRRASFEPSAYDVAMCLGASFVFGGLAGTLDALEPVVRPGGHVVVGEPFWRRWPLPADYEDRDGPFTSLDGTADDLRIGRSSGRLGDRIFSGRLGPVRDAPLACLRGVARCEPRRSRRGRYRARRYERSKRSYLRYSASTLGWAIFVGWKRP